MYIFGNFPINRVLAVRQQKTVDLRKRTAAEKSAVRAQRARVCGLQNQARIGAVLNERGFFLCLRAPEDKGNRLLKRAERRNHRVREALPAKVLVGVCCVCLYGEHRVEQKHTLLCPRAQIAVWRNRNAEVGLQLLIDILQRRRQFYPRLYRKSKPVCLSRLMIGILPENHHTDCLRDALEPLRDQYDYIFIDCPPSLELLTLNALCAADEILIPVQCEYYALEGLSDLMMTLRAVKRKLNPTLGIFGVLLTMYDGRTNFSAQVAQEVRRHFPGKVFAAVIPRNVRLSEAPSHGLPILAYDRFSRGAAAYDALVQEILTKGA